MRNYDERRREIETIKERAITLNLSDADCSRITEKAGSVGLTISGLLESFIGDLVDGTYTNGSDERMYAQDWFDRCWFAMFPAKTLLRYLLSVLGGDDVSGFLMAYDEKVYYETHPEEYAEDVAELTEGEKLWFIEEVDAVFDDWKPEAGSDIEKEVELCRKWLAERERLLKGE